MDAFIDWASTAATGTWLLVVLFEIERTVPLTKPNVLLIIASIDYRVYSLLVLVRTHTSSTTVTGLCACFVWHVVVSFCIKEVARECRTILLPVVKVRACVCCIVCVAVPVFPSAIETIVVRNRMVIDV